MQGTRLIMTFSDETGSTTRGSARLAGIVQSTFRNRPQAHCARVAAQAAAPCYRAPTEMEPSPGCDPKQSEGVH
jgi:hypothetical protein